MIYFVQPIHDWVLLVIVGVVVSIDVVILFIGTAIPQARLEANVIRDPDHDPTANVR